MNTPSISLASHQLLVFAIAVGACAGQSLVATTGQVLLGEGSPIPGVPGAINSGSGGLASLDGVIADRAGDVLFRGHLTGAVTPNVDDSAYFLGRASGDLRVLLRSNDPEPSLTYPGATLLQDIGGGATLEGLGDSPRISAENNFILFGAHLAGPGIVSSGVGLTNSALYWGVGGTWQIVAQRGTVSPVGNALYDSDFATFPYQGTAVNSLGMVCFGSALVGGDVVGQTNNIVTLAGFPGALQVVQRRGDVVLSGQVIDNGSVFRQMNLLGQVLHDETLSISVGTPPSPFNEAACLFLWTPTTGNQLLARQGGPAPGTAGSLYGLPNAAQGLGDSGKAAFYCTLTGPGVLPGVDDQAVFVGSPGNVQLVSRKHDQAPGLPAGVLMSIVAANPCYSDYQGGTVGFFTTLQGTGVNSSNDSSFWLASASQRQLVCREGDPAPGWSSVPNFVSAVFGPVIDTSARATTAGPCLLNERGQVVLNSLAVKVTTVDPVTLANVVTTVNDNSYCWDPQLGLRLLFANGDQIPTALGPVVATQARFVRFSSGGGSALGLNDDGDVVLQTILPTGGAIVRGRVGSMNCGASSIAEATGGVHTMRLDAGASNAGNLYAVAATASGTRPGFAFTAGNGTFNIPLNNDWVTAMSISSLTFSPGTPWGTTLGFLDGTGRGTATLTIPASTGFIGLDVDHAYAVLDPGFNVLHVSAPCGVLLY